MQSITMFHIPVCPFSQRVEILLELKGVRDRVRFETVDITKPRDPALVAKARTSALPVLELADGRVLKESLVLLQYFDERFPERRVAQRDPYRRAVESLLTGLERDFVAAGYTLILNQDLARRDALRDRLLALHAGLDDFLVQHSPRGTFLFEELGWAEAVFTPMFMRFWFLEYYEGFELPDEARFARVRRWRDACLAHPATQQVTHEEIVKLYYDYAKGAGNGALLPGRQRSSFAFEPHWSKRPWPPADKYASSATDVELGLL
ncbi:MAG: glutathione S-transferase family protein [Myxococcota bacterium]|nr:glutathione S-transferase family protein [Myxococcota bacterium]